MLRHIFLTCCSALCVLLLSVAQTNLRVRAADSDNKTMAPSKRILRFPEDTSLGALTINSWDGVVVSFAASARGIVKLNVPTGQLVSLEVLGKALEKPELLDKVRDQPIDCLAVRFLSVDDSEEGTTDRVLAHVAGIKSLVQVRADHSDASDRGFAHIAQMPNLRVVCMFCSEVQGECFKQLATCPNLTELAVWNCPLKENNVKYLSGFTKLQMLDIRHTNLTDAGVAAIARCTSLRNLRLAENEIDDRCAVELRNLIHLQRLDLQKTQITMVGIRRLRGLGLKWLQPPKALSAQEREEVGRLFPGIRLVVPGTRQLSKEDMEMFAPLH